MPKSRRKSIRRWLQLKNKTKKEWVPFCELLSSIRRPDSEVLDQLFRINDGCKITAVVDVQIESVKKMLEAKVISSEDITFYRDVDDLLRAGDIDGIFIGTRCDIHTEFALKIIPAGIPLFME